MSANPHASEPVVHLGPEIHPGSAVTILIHGRNQEPAYMIEIARRLALPEMPYLALTAANRTWYPKSFLEPVENNRPALDVSLDHLDTVIRDLVARGIDRSRIALVGFSQGACLAAEYIYRQGGRWGAIAVLTGGTVGPLDIPGSGRDRSLAGTPVFFGNGDADDFVPLTRTRATYEAFVKLGAKAEIAVYPGRDHSVNDDEIAKTRELLVEMIRTGA